MTDTPIHDSIAQPAIEAPVATLTALDRCDACASGAERAYVGVTIDQTELLFCAHHFVEHEDELLAYVTDGAQIRDERWQIEQAENTRLGDIEGDTGTSSQCAMGDHRHCPEPQSCDCSCHPRRR